MSQVKDIWDKGAPIYDEIYTNNIAYHKSHEAIAGMLPMSNPIEVLDLGAGTGLLASRILQSIPGSRVTCLEFSANMLEHARQRLEPFSGRAAFVGADMTLWQPERNYDAIVTYNALVYKDIDLGGCYRKYAGHLKPGGLMLNSTLVESEHMPLFAQIAQNAAAPNPPPLSPLVIEFAKTTGRAIAHFGPDSLAFVVSVKEHLRLLAEAGLVACCLWQYLVQVVVGGVKR